MPEERCQSERDDGKGVGLQLVDENGRKKGTGIVVGLQLVRCGRKKGGSGDGEGSTQKSR